jgi:hypothetical protein
MSIKKFAFIAEGDVFHTWEIAVDDHGHSLEMLLAGLTSNPIIVEVLDPDMPVGPGWTYDGTRLIPPN